MIERILATRLAVGVVLALSACGGAWGTDGLAWATASYRERTGNVTEADLLNRLPRVLARHGYLIVDGWRYSRQYRFTTQWKYRQPFEDERARGATEAKTRILMWAQEHDGSGRAEYVLHLEVQNRVRNASAGWHEAPATDAFEDYAGDIARDVRVSIASGMRRF